MATYSAAQAELELQKILSGERPATLDEVNKIISDLDVTDTKADANAKTILYSGINKDTAKNLVNNPNNRILNNTEAFKFLNDIQTNEDFAEVWEKITGSKPDWKSDYSGEVDKFIGGVDGNPRTKGAWDTISENFVKATDGDIVIYAGDDAKAGRVFFQTEWEAIKNSDTIKTINGIDINEMKSSMLSLSSDEAFKGFQSMTKQRIEIANVLQKDFDKLTSNDVKSFWEEPSYKTEQGEIYKKVNTLPNAEGINVGKVLKYLNKLGPLGVAASFMLASSESAQAYELGDTQKAQNIMTEWAVDEAGSAAGGAVGAVIGGVALAVAGALGATVAAPITIAVVAAASVAGAFAGSDLANYLYEEYDSVTEQMNSYINKLQNINIEVLIDIISDIDFIFDFDIHQIKMADPLVLDTNKDGFISTIALEDSNAYFNIVGDEQKERVGWIKPEDGILVYDKNENGQVDGFSEVFGNSTTSGFDELRAVADSNNDGKINRQDELYSQLQVWHDYNADGNVETILDQLVFYNNTNYREKTYRV